MRLAGYVAITEDKSNARRIWLGNLRKQMWHAIFANVETVASLRVSL
jgi:hypothetical protein